MTSKATAGMAIAMLLSCLAAAAQPVAGIPAPPVQSPTPALTDSKFAFLEALIKDLMSKAGVPGMAVAVVRDGAVWSRGFGVVSADTGSPVTVDTVFEAASLGKPVFAYAVIRLAERGVFDLDRPLTFYLANPDVRNDDRIRKVTARLVLSHSAGFPNWRHGKELTIEFEPGEKFGYSGEGYLYLQKVIESVTGETIDEVVRKEVFAPLGMNASSFVWRAAYERTAAIGHDYLQLPAPKSKPTTANVATSLHTTVGDYARFLAEVLRPTLVKPSTAATMVKPQVEVQKDLSWSLGWGLERSGDRRLLWHWGDNDTFRSFVIGDRETNVGVVVLTNSENGLSIAEPIVTAEIPGPYPAFAWLDVDRYDSPARTIRERLVRAGVANGERGVYRTLAELDHTFPSEVFTESLLNRIGYELLAKKRPAAAVMVFERNAKLYPKSWNVYDSLAEAHAADGDLRLAISFYERSLKLNPDNENAKSAIRELKDALRR